MLHEIIQTIIFQDLTKPAMTPSQHKKILVLNFGMKGGGRYMFSQGMLGLKFVFTVCGVGDSYLLQLLFRPIMVYENQD